MGHAHGQSSDCYCVLGGISSLRSGSALPNDDDALVSEGPCDNAFFEIFQISENSEYSEIFQEFMKISKIFRNCVAISFFLLRDRLRITKQASAK